MGTTTSEHVPVLLSRVVELLAPALAPPEAILVDATVGRAGHAAALLAEHPSLRLVGIDADAEAIAQSGRRLASFGTRVRLVHGRFDRVIGEELPTLLAEDLAHVRGVLFDLGVSSPQLDTLARGFAYSYDAPLDMRMNRDQEFTAADVVNTYPLDELARVLRDYGEERFARRIARAIVRERARAPFESTRRLADLVRDCIPAATRRSGGHPAKRTFQALRIEVNGELVALRRALPSALDMLAVGGRIVVLSYHSLEDRLVKRALAARVVDRTPPGLPVTLPHHQPQFRLLTRGAEAPDQEEITRNPRAASARLRAAERIRPDRSGGGSAEDA